MDTERRRELGTRNRQWGIEAENLAYEYFLKKGYVIRERNWRVGRLEVDLILEKDRTIIFVEVKARAKDTQDPVEAVNSKKRRNIVRAADVYLRRLAMLYEYRFDLFTVTGDINDYRIEHYADAFLPQVNGGKK